MLKFRGVLRRGAFFLTLFFGDSLVVLMAFIERLLGVMLTVTALVSVSLGFGDGAGAGGQGLVNSVCRVHCIGGVGYPALWYCLALSGILYCAVRVCSGAG